MKYAAIISLIIVTSAPAFAANPAQSESCRRYAEAGSTDFEQKDGKLLNQIDIATVFFDFRHKGEFETTAEYNINKSAFFAKSRKWVENTFDKEVTIIRHIDADSEMYDADRQLLTISPRFWVKRIRGQEPNEAYKYISYKDTEIAPTKDSDGVISKMFLGVTIPQLIANSVSSSIIINMQRDEALAARGHLALLVHGKVGAPYFVMQKEKLLLKGLQIKEIVHGALVLNEFSCLAIIDMRTNSVIKALIK